MSKQIQVTQVEIALLVGHAANHEMSVIARRCKISEDKVGLMTYALRKRLGMGPLTSIREWARENMNNLVVSL